MSLIQSFGELCCNRWSHWSGGAIDATDPLTPSSGELNRSALHGILHRNQLRGLRARVTCFDLGDRMIDVSDPPLTGHRSHTFAELDLFLVSFESEVKYLCQRHCNYRPRSHQRKPSTFLDCLEHPWCCACFPGFSVEIYMSFFNYLGSWCHGLWVGRLVSGEGFPSRKLIAV